MLAGVAPLFVGALLADWAYARSYQIEWSNFASWLLIGAMVLATRGRPVGVAVDPHGALIVADDLSNTIWRIAPGP
jgi:glucose/arabinose dehydrogenase